MANKRILQFDTAEQLEDDDYLLIDHQDEGTRKILASQVGGGSGSYSETVLYTGNDYNATSYTLSDSLLNYDAIMVKCIAEISASTFSKYTTNNIFLVSDLLQELGTGVKFFCGTDTWYRYFTVSSNMVLEVADKSYLYVAEIIGIKFGGGSGGSSSEVIPISAGDDTTSRTFTFNKTPKFIKFYWKDPNVDLGWYLDASLIWGQDWMPYQAYYLQTAVQGNHDGTASVSYNGNRITITGGNAFGAMNSPGGSGYMYVEY